MRAVRLHGIGDLRVEDVAAPPPARHIAGQVAGLKTVIRCGGGCLR